MSLPETRYSLIARLAKVEDIEAWSDFVQTYQGAILRYCRSRGLQDADAVEVAQEVFLVTHRAAETWEPSGHSGSFRAWIFETARRNCLQFIRKRTRNPETLDEHAAFESPEYQDDLESSHHDWQVWAFYAAAQRVQSEIQHQTWQAFWKTTVDGRDPQTVADELQMSIGSVYTAKCRVMARIRKSIEQLSIQ